MADLFLDRIIAGDGKARYNIVRQNGAVVESNVELVLVSTIEQEGDKFGAREVNKLLKKENSKVVVDIEMEGY